MRGPRASADDAARGVRGRVDEVLELPLDVGEQRARAEPEQVGAQPAVAQLFLHQIQVLERILRGANAAGRLEADRVAGLLEVLADHPAHHDAERNRRVHAFLAGRRLDEVGAGLHRDHARPRDVAERRQLAGGENRLHVRVAAGLAEAAHLVVQRLVVAREHVRARDDDVDLLRAGGHARADLLDALLDRAQARREIPSTPRRPECPIPASASTAVGTSE